MKRLGTKMLSLVLALVLAVGLMPTTAWASLGDLLTRDTAYNQAILDALNDVTGSEDEARMYYEILRQYGLLDEDGSTVDSWTITMNGEEVTLEDIRALLNGGSYDPEQYVWVDGSPITLENLRLILEIEDYIAYIRETYFADGYEWTEEQRAGLNSFLSQLSATGVQVFSAGAAGTVSVVQTAGTATSATFTASVENGIQGQEISFQWEAQEGTQPLTGTRSGTVSFTVGADGTGSADFTVFLKTAAASDILSTGGLSYCVQLTGLTGAQFGNGHTAMTLRADGQSSGTISSDAIPGYDEYSKFFPYNYNLVGTETLYAVDWDWNLGLTSSANAKLRNAMEWGLVDSVQVGNEYSNTGIGFLRNVTTDTALWPVLVSGQSNQYESYLVDENGTHVTPTTSDDFVVRYFYASIAVGGTTVAEAGTGFKSMKDGYDSTKGTWGYTVTLGPMQEEEGPLTHVLTAEERSSLLNGSAILTGTYFYNENTNFDLSPIALIYDGANKSWTMKGDGGSGNFRFNQFPGSVTIYLRNTVAPEIESITAPAGAYTYGQQVPIVVTFSEPTQLSRTSILVNGTDTLTPVNSGISDKALFFYSVKRFDNAGITVQSAATTGVHVLTESKYDNDNCALMGAISGVRFEVDPADTIGDAAIGYPSDGSDYNQHLEGNVSLVEDAPIEWLTQHSLKADGSTYTQDELDAMEKAEPGSADGITSFYVCLSGPAFHNSGTQYPLTRKDVGSNRSWYAMLPLDPPFAYHADAAQPGYSVQVYLGGNLVRTTVSVGVPGLFLWEEGDIEPTVTVTDTEGEVYDYAGQSNTFFIDTVGTVQAGYRIADGGKTFSTSTFTTYQLNENGSGYAAGEDGEKIPVPLANGSAANFVWWTSDPSVATIDANGVITPTGASGTVKVYLTALNGDQLIYDSADGQTAKRPYTYTASYTFSGADGTQTTTETLTFGAGKEPILQVPEDRIAGTAGTPLRVTWTSNLTEKNAENSRGTTTFTAKLYRSTSAGGELVWSEDLESTTASRVSSVQIPGDVLGYDYQGGGNTFTLVISASYYDLSGTAYPYSAAVTITLETPPARVALGDLDSYYIVDTGGDVTINWTVTSFDYYSSQSKDNTLFRFSIIDDNGESPIEGGEILVPGTQQGSTGSYTGSYTLPISRDTVQASPESPTSYRKVYTVTVQAKNGNASTWSYDSFLLYVYDADALQIMVNGKAGTDHTLSNETLITTGEGGEVNKDAWRDWVLSLNRDIYLKEIISVNYGTYAWNEVADQIAWSLTEDGAPAASATLNYQQGTLYENIDLFSYVSYRPTADFGLAGLSDGSVRLTATHKLTGMEKSITIGVDSMKDRLYLFQCYPQATTRLTFEVYTDETGTATEEVTAYSDESGAAAYYAEYGIASNIYCQTMDGENTVTGPENRLYTGTFYLSNLKSGEGDWTKSQRYPVNNLNLRQAAYAYLYLKTPEGAPYTGDVIFRGGVYLNDEYRESAKFTLRTTANGKNYFENISGDKDTTITVGADGRLEIIMDQTQWGPEEEGYLVSPQDAIRYVFQIEAASGSGGYPYYPMLVTVDATANLDAYVSNGEAVVNFRENPTPASQHPFISAQAIYYDGASRLASVLGSTGNIGPSNAYKTAHLNTVVMWWGAAGEEAAGIAENAALSLKTSDGAALCTAQEYHTLDNSAYPFSDIAMTQYDVTLNNASLNGILSGDGTSTLGLVLDYYADGATLSRRESLPFRLSNTSDVEPIREADSLLDMLSGLGQSTSTRDHVVNGLTDDNYVLAAMKLVGGDDYTEETDGLFGIRFAPTDDPTKFLGLIYVNAGDVQEGDEIQGLEFDEDPDTNYTPGLSEMQVLTNRKTVSSYLDEQMADMQKAVAGKGMRDTDFAFSGYMESLIYWSYNTGTWNIQILNGGFNAGAGLSYSWNINTWCGPVPFTATLTIGGSGQVSMDALTVAYYDQTTMDSGMGTDFLTELRIYLYLKFFAGVGFDYSVIAFKLGVYGQISLDMRFQWLNRPYMYGADGNRDPNIVNPADPATGVDTVSGNLSGQRIRIDGEIGMEFLVKFLFVSYNKVLYSYSFNLADWTLNQWNDIDKIWEANENANQALIEELLATNSLSVMNAAGQEVYALNLAPTLESRDYLSDGSGSRAWLGGADSRSNGISLFSLDPAGGSGDGSKVQYIQSNSYPYSDPLVTSDGAVMVYLADMGSEDVNMTQAAWASNPYIVNDYDTSPDAYYPGDSGSASSPSDVPIGSGGCGDSQLALGGPEDFAVAAWTRQTEPIGKAAGEALTAEDQMRMLNSTEIYAAVKVGNSWTEPAALTDNSTPDLAPAAASTGNYAKGTAIVAWRSVAASDGDRPTTFDQKDTILYRVYHGGQQYTGENQGWSETYTLYNGTSGSVKGIEAAMTKDGTAAVVYTLDLDGDDATTNDREVYYAVINSGESWASGDYDPDAVIRSVRVTNDNYLDENPQITAVSFYSGAAQEFVLGWYSEQAVSTDSAQAFNGSGSGTGPGAEDLTDAGETTSDIRLVTFAVDGSVTQRLPDSLSQVASDGDVSITSNFRFAKGAAAIEQLSILWVERATEIGTDLFATEEDGKEPQKWTESSGEIGSEYDASKIEYNERDVLKSVKFYKDGEAIRFTGALTLADMADAADGTLIDNFDAYVARDENGIIDSGNRIRAVILGTTYGASTRSAPNGVTAKTVLLADGETAVQVAVPTSSTAMYTAEGSYTDAVSVNAVLADYDTVRLGSKTQIQFTVKNEGIHVVDSLTIALTDPEGTAHTEGETGTTETTVSELNLLPGQTISVYADYRVPASGVVDPAYTVTPNFSDAGASGDAESTSDLAVTGTIYLDLPDVEITQAQVVKEESGRRTIQVKLNNHADAALAPGKNAVRLSFYSDPARQNPIPASYFIKDGSGTEGYTLTISDEASLAMINEGGYAAQVTFDVGGFVRDGEEEDREIPAGGVTVYLKAEVLGIPAGEEDASGSGDTGIIASFSGLLRSVGLLSAEPYSVEDMEPQGEPVCSDNYASVTCENLQVRTGEDVTLTQSMSKDGDTVTVYVTVQNNLLTETTTGNLIVTLLGADGQVLATKESYDETKEDCGLITLKGEQKRSGNEFTFTGTDVSIDNVQGVRVTYVEMEIPEKGGALSANTNLTALTVEGVSLTRTENTDGTVTYTGTATDAAVDLSATQLLTAVAADPGAKVTVRVNDGEPVKSGSYNAVQNISLHMGTNTVIVTVAAPDGTEAAYTAAITITERPAAEEPTDPGGETTDPGENPATPGGGSAASYAVTVQGGIANGDVAVSPSRAGQGSTVTVTVTPDEGYELDTLTVTDADGSKLTLIDKGNGRYTFTMPRGAVSVAASFKAAEEHRPSGFPFTDVTAGDWYYDAVVYAWENELMTGTSAATFAPGMTTDRAMMTTLLWRLEGSPVVNYLLDFTDVAEGLWYSEAVRWAASEGVVNGVGDGSAFAPTGAITREQMAVMLYRYAQYKGYDVTGSADLSGYTDAAGVSGWAQYAVQWAVDSGLISGVGNSTLNPQGSATRAEIATILMRFIETFIPAE